MPITTTHLLNPDLAAVWNVYNNLEKQNPSFQIKHLRVGTRKTIRGPGCWACPVDEEQWPWPREAAGPRVNGWIDGWTDAKATAEQVKRERSSLTCQNDVYCGWGQGERYDIIMPANRGSQCQSNLQPENTWLRKAMNMIRPSNRCSLTHPSEKTCVSKHSGSEGIQLIFPVCIWENRPALFLRFGSSLRCTVSYFFTAFRSSSQWSQLAPT